MDLRFFYAILLTIMPITELRAGLPLGLAFANDNGVPLLLIFALIILTNILVIFFIFYFMDFVHVELMKWNFYQRHFDKFLEKFQRKVDKFEKRYDILGFIALTLFVAVPLPGTGAWTGSILAWVLGLDRKKSILAISLGVIIAGIIIFLGTLGVMALMGTH